MSHEGGILLCAPQASVSPSLQPGSQWTAIGLRCSEMNRSQSGRSLTPSRPQDRWPAVESELWRVWDGLGGLHLHAC